MAIWNVQTIQTNKTAESVQQIPSSKFVVDNHNSCHHNHKLLKSLVVVEVLNVSRTIRDAMNPMIVQINQTNKDATVRKRN